VSQTFFISDLHIGHKNILKFSGDYRDGDTVDEHDHTLIVKYNSRVRKRDVCYILGDVCFDIKKMEYFDELNGTKILMLGNHDLFQLGVYQKYFDDIIGFSKKCGFWLSHAPMHPAELRGKQNIHGHVHANSIRNAYSEYDKRYINVCCEVNNGYPISLDEIRDGRYWDMKRC